MKTALRVKESGVVAGWIIPIVKKWGIPLVSFIRLQCVRSVALSVQSSVSSLSFRSKVRLQRMTNLRKSETNGFLCSFRSLLIPKSLMFLCPLSPYEARHLMLRIFLTAKFPASSFLLHDDNGDGDGLTD